VSCASLRFFSVVILLVLAFSALVALVISSVTLCPKALSAALYAASTSSILSERPLSLPIDSFNSVIDSLT
jgi:hypothetical protein